MMNPKHTAVGVLFAGLLLLAGIAGAGSSISGRNDTGQRIVPDCLCGVVEGSATSRCFVDSFCANAAGCSTDIDCEDGEFCLNDDNCCGTPKCVAGCSTLSCTVGPGAGTCDTYEVCDPSTSSCGFNNAYARGVKISMVRDYAPCPGTELPTANTATESGTDACAPVTPDEIVGDGTLYSFGPKGKCEVSTKAQVVGNCLQLTDDDGELLGLESGPCHVTFVKSRCSGMLGTDAQTPLLPGSDDGWTLATLSRATLADDSNGDMTVIDFPVTFQYDTVLGGLKLDSNSAIELIPLVGVTNAELPACTSIEFVDLVIKDPAGLPFARPGDATVPAGTLGFGGDCEFDIAPARGIKASMVRSWAPCPGNEHPTSNTSTEGGTEACKPVTPDEAGGNATPYNYSAKGKCDVQAVAKLLADCSGLEDESGSPLGLAPDPCHVTFLKSKCKGIVDANGAAISGADDGWTLATISRATLADDIGGDMTVVDFPVTFLYSTPSGGSMRLQSHSAAGLAPLVGVAGASLPVCTQLQLVDMTIKDPGGLPFAKMGGATIPK